MPNIRALIARPSTHLSATGTRLGLSDRHSPIPYDVEVGSGVTYLLDAGPTGHVQRIAPNGAVTTISRR
jgi:hypothetical protein